MTGRRTRTFVSTMLISSGTLLLFLGASDFLESRFGQTEAARQFAAPASLPASTAPSPRAAVPAIGSTIARLIIPRLPSELYALEGDSPRELRRGPGHLQGTAMPGGKGNCVIAGHRISAC